MDFDDIDVTAEFVEPKKLNKKKVQSNKIIDLFSGFKDISPFQKKILFSFSVLFLFVLIAGSFCFYCSSFKKTNNVKSISLQESTELSLLLDEMYHDKRVSILKKLPYGVSPAVLDVWAGSAILIDASNGCVLYEKNADKIIPPASIAKLFVMYVVFKEVEKGNVTLDDVVPVPEKSWAVNMPRDASLMFLGQGHVVTLRELLKGLAVASGNDAAIAVGNFISGSTSAFVERMNEECAALGLSKTHFVEPSGYDENNLTSARDLAAFCCEYINKFPLSIQEFHSAPSIKYPLEKNLPSWKKHLGDSEAIYQKNTNPLLGSLDGCDGIKTGFIYESGYNLALTAMRNGVRYISVTLEGPGIGSKQGNAGRVHDGTELMEWAFESFADFDPKSAVPQFISIPAIGSKNTNGKFVKLIPAWSNTITVPHLEGATALDDAASIKVNVSVPKFIYGGVKAGTIYGEIQYSLGNVVLETVPLVADRTYERSGIPGRIIGALVSWKI